MMKRWIVLSVFVCPIFGFAATEDMADDVTMTPPIGLEETDAAIVTQSPETKLEVASTATKKATVVKKEAEIPVLTNVKSTEAASSQPYARMIFSFFIIAITAVALMFFSRWWKKRQGVTAENTKIRVLTQHHLGPKKSLAIIRVAGESMLIGITDQNISMIKSLALIDDEFTDTPSASFAKSLNEVDARPKTEREDVEEFAFTQIKDKVSQRIKEMRPLG